MGLRQVDQTAGRWADTVRWWRGRLFKVSRGRWAEVRRLRQGARHWALSLGAVGGDSPGSTLKGWRGGASSLQAGAV
jgi:hypothetical protein